jgi:SAM-dependent methyltransferase
MHFVIEVLKPECDDIALDIGCGLGTQLFPVAERVRRIVGLDLSAEIIGALRGRLQPNVEVVVGDMDDIADLDGGTFTLVYAVYSLYYSRDPAAVVGNIARRLSAGGRFVSVNPDIGNNAEWFEDLGRLYEVPADARGVPELCRSTILPAFEQAFPAVRQISYCDRIRFPSLEALMAYYDACAPYCRPDKRTAAQRHFGAKFERDGSYQITKCSLAVVGRS